ncbi:Probable inactive dehydrogenase [Sparassis crispa]|uniref:Probable inactive dehydrogenase n=1 Tax=Sparassis crispa TaxID=139825 RepID=A0A401GQY6_9APHY|nr:Probable inactive dehydrogenase [Sparassis crispa]GBE84579.1 Probable inactive dehydrogenase [Sparassis crispa]
MPSPSNPALFRPTKVGYNTLAHRVVLAPLTRMRADAEHVHGELAVAYYAQRAHVPGTLLITEGTYISPRAGGYPHVPGIWNDAQIAAWKRVRIRTSGYGRRARASLLHISPDLRDGADGLPYVAPSAIALSGQPRAPRPLTLSEIQEYIEMYATAASNAVHRAGFDGVELQGANGYLVDQFLQDVSNDRTDAYGGSVENRCRFALETIGAIVHAVGARKTALRVSPWNKFLDMGMEDPVPTFTHLVQRLADAHPDLAYLHVVEPRRRPTDSRGAQNNSLSCVERSSPPQSNDFLRSLWAPRPLISAGGYTARQHSPQRSGLGS